jgi:hypothetical protein
MPADVGNGPGQRERNDLVSMLYCIITGAAIHFDDGYCFRIPN